MRRIVLRGLGIELAVGLFLPCNVVLAEDDGEMVASAVSPRAMFASIVPRPEGLDALADEVEEKLRRAIAAI